MAEFILDGLVAKAKLKPGTYRLFTDANEDMPWGGPVDGTEFIVPEPGQAAGDGAQGVKGDKGDAGDTGPMGPQGPQGNPGLNGGELGAKGPTGDKGSVGDKGPAGDQGAKGVTGDKGPAGDAGTGGGSTVINISGGNLPKPTTTAELQALANAAASGNYVVVLAPGTKVTLTDTIVFRQSNHDGSVWGMDCSWAQLDWAGPAGGDMIRAEGVTGQANRGFVFMNAQLYGGGWWQDRGRANDAGACFKITCPGGDSMAYYKATLHNIYTSYAENGFVFEGAVFEFMHFNLHAENMTGDGMVAKSMGGAIMSNAFGIAPNMSRNGGSGINTGYSHNIIMGSFIQNSQFAINANDGLRVAAFNNGENTGQSLIRLGYDGYGSVIIGNELATGAVGVNNENAPSTGHSQFILDVPPTLTPTLPNNGNHKGSGTIEQRLAALEALVESQPAADQMWNHVSSYGGGDALVKRVRK